MARYTSTAGIAVLAGAFGIGETAYFGNNWAPQSGAEFICDGVMLLLFAMAYIAYAIERRP